MSVQVFQANLIEALKVLNQRWSRIRERWDDPASRQIQAELIEPQEALIRNAVKSLGQVNDLMAAARRDCADDA